MDASRRAPGYDLFKLIVAIVLLIVALILMWTTAPQTPEPASTPLPSQPGTVSVSPTPPPPTATLLPITPTMELSEPTWTPFPPSTETSTFQLTATPPPPTATETPELSPTPISPPTATPPPGPIETPIAGTPPADVCRRATSRSRLQPGQNATILRRLNFRSSPGIRDNWLLTNPPGTQVEVIGGPECVPYWTGAYLWWQIRLPDGRVGWSAEGSLHGSFYFIEPR